MIKPFIHQDEAAKLFKKNKGILGCFFKQGIGKTLTTILCFKFIKKQIPSAKLLVTCPLPLIIYDSWLSDINKFSDFTCQDLHKDIYKIDPSVDIYLTNYEMFRSKKKLAVIESLLKEGKFMWALDESSFIKNASSLQCKRILSIRHLAKYKMCLSGTPCPNTELELWPQITFLMDDVFHRKYHVFKHTYFHLDNGKQQITGDALKVMSWDKRATQTAFKRGFKYTITEEKKIRMLEKIEPFCTFKKKKDCPDIVFTDQIFIPKYITMGKKQQDIYNEMKKHMIIEINNEHILANMAIKKIMKLRQITSGFIYGEDSCHMIEGSAKIKALKYDIERFGGEQIIIWGNFVKEIEIIKELLGEKAGCVYGGVRENMKKQNIADYKSGKLQYLVANPQSISHGLTFLNSHYQINFSVSDSFERMDQSKDRDHRIGQLEDCTYYYYLCKGSVDETIYQNVQNKASAEEFVHAFLNS